MIALAAKHAASLTASICAPVGLCDVEKWVDKMPTSAPWLDSKGVDCTALTPARQTMSRHGPNCGSSMTSSMTTDSRLRNARAQADVSESLTHSKKFKNSS